MRCIKCGCKADLFTTSGETICRSCAEKESFVICLKLGKVIVDKNFHCDNLCNDCIYKEEIEMLKLNK